MKSAAQASAGIGLDPRSRQFAEIFAAFLRERGQLDDPAISRAVRATREAGERFDVALSRLGLIGEQDLAAAVADFLGVFHWAELPAGVEPFEHGEIDPSFLRRHRVAPLTAPDGAFIVLAADALDRQPSQALAYLVDRPLRIAAGSDSLVQQVLDQFFPVSGTAGERADGPAALAEPAGRAAEDDVRRLSDLASEAPVIRRVHKLIGNAVNAGASDIHLEPVAGSLRVRLRLDGLLEDQEAIDPGLAAAVVSRIKIMAHLDIAERRRPQDGRIRTNVRGREIDLRVATIPTLQGETVVLRILDRASVALDFGALGFRGRKLDDLMGLIAQPNGLILVTGPTGSGKTTTLYAALSQLNDPARKIFTIEDPIEYQLPGINQVQVHPALDFTFARALRSILRHDPDLVMVGEIRDLETAEMAVQSALTGHLVLSTLHTNGAAATIARLIDMGVADYLIGSTLKGILAQRLVRRLCRSCSQPVAAPPELAAFVAAMPAGHAPRDLDGVRGPAGCAHCRDTGFQGRIAISELMPVDADVRRAIAKGADDRDLVAAARAGGFVPLIEDGIGRVLEGTTTFEEVLRVSQLA